MSRDSKGVNDLLHSLRGEQFRRLQNLTHSRRPHTVKNIVPDLSTRLANVETYGYAPAGQEVTVTRSGPAPPKSWQARPNFAAEGRDTPRWRTEALKVVAQHLGQWERSNRVPPLSGLCLQVILSSHTNQKHFGEGVVPQIPGHIRRNFIRHCAIHSPLGAWELEALWKTNGHADGEIMITGPTCLRKDHLRISMCADSASDWEHDRVFTPLYTLIFLSTSLSGSILLSIPPTITKLVLVNLSSPQPLHRLPKSCPLLELLDLSYNIWLRDSSGEGYEDFERIQWVCWSQLETVGLRECYVTAQQLQRIEEGRWDGINIIC